MSDATRTLLRCGIIAAPLYLLVGYAQALTREGFDFRRHALSQLAQGEMGWIQTANFIVTGLLVIAGAVGVRRVLKGQRAGTWGPILLTLFGLGMLGASAFPADAGNGFPPGTPETAEMTRTGIMHFMFGAITFYALILACFVFARRFLGQQRTGMAVVSILTGLGFLGSFSAIAMGTTSAMVVPAFYVAVTWSMLWHSVLIRDVAHSRA
jgi:hypothetical membrane protein